MNKIKIPFYNHYFENSPTRDRLSPLLWEEGIFLSERPCLCQTPGEILPLVAIIHGDRDIADPCYDKIKEYIAENPQTRFFILAVSLSFYGLEAIEQVKNRLGAHSNYVPWVNSNSNYCFEELRHLAKIQ